MSSAAMACITAIAAPAEAQREGGVDTQSAAVEAERDGENPIVITGTRVVRDGFQAPTPLTVLTKEDIDNSSPTNNIADFVNQLPQLAGSTKPSNSRLSYSNGSAGINALNLRNLGEGRTLILLDGRRSVGSTIFGWVDVNTIPQALVERVDVVTGGASSAYGSDAVAGVVNFVLARKLEGLRVEGDVGVTTVGDGFNYSGSVSGGTSFADGRGHIIFNAEIAHQDGIFSIDPSDRPWQSRGNLTIQNPAWTANATVPQFLTSLQGLGVANAAPGGIIIASTGGAANRLAGLYFGPGGSVNQYQYGAFNIPTLGPGVVPTYTQGGDWLLDDSFRRVGLLPEDDRWGVFGRASFEVADGIELFAIGSYNKQNVFFRSAPNGTNAALNTTGCTIVPVPVSCNAFALQTLGAARLAGITQITVSTSALDVPSREIDNERQVQRYVLGAEGGFDAFGKPARWDVYGQYGRSDVREQIRNIAHSGRLVNATAAAFAPAGNAGGYATGSIQCLINVDANPNNNDPSCVPINRLGIGVASPAAIDYVLGDPYREQVLEQIVTGANLSLTPFSTWAGGVSVAVGAEYREEKIRGSVPPEFQPVTNPNGSTTNQWQVGNYLPFSGKYNVKEAYLETVVPLGFGLEFNGAVRATDYSTAGYVTTWKAGATWQPIDDIRLRVTRSRDIRAPNLNELFQAGTTLSGTIPNLGFTPDGANGPQRFSVAFVTTGNPDLKPEIANSWNVGAVVAPRFLPGFTASVDYFRIDLEGAIQALGVNEINVGCFEGREEFCDLIVEDPARSAPGAPFYVITSRPVNFVRRLVRGIDFDAAYRRQVGGNGNILLKGVATRYIENITDTGFPGVPVLNSVGVNGGQFSTPKWIYRFSGTYSTPDYSITGVARGVSAGRYNAAAIECQTNCPVSTPQFPTYDDNRVPGTFYVDLNVTTKFDAMGDGDGEFFVNVTNLFDADPLLIPESGISANTTYSDMLGRTFRVGMRIRLH